MRKMSKLVALIAAVTLLAACGGPKPPTSSPETAPVAAASDANAAAEAQAKEKQALEAGVEAVVYGLPLVIMDITRAKTSNVARPEGFAAPVNQFVNVREFPDASFRDVVRANVDTLYSSAWLDLSKEPIVLSVPDTKGRYYLMPMMDAWTNIFASPGKRTTGTKPGHFAITGPGWSGTLPGGVTELKSPTNMVWIIGRTQTNGPRRLRGGACDPGRLQARPAVVFRQAVHAAGRHGRPERRHEDGARRPAEGDELGERSSTGWPR